MRLLAALGIIFASSVAVSGEVGTQYPNDVESSNSALTLSLAENGAGSSWAIEPVSFQATSHQTAKLNKQIEQMNLDLTAKINASLADKIDTLLN